MILLNEYNARTLICFSFDLHVDTFFFSSLYHNDVFIKVMPMTISGYGSVISIILISKLQDLFLFIT